MPYYNHYKEPFLQIENYDIDPNIAKIIPEEMARYYKIIAIDKIEHFKKLKILTIGSVNPDNKKIIYILERQLNCTVLSFKININGWTKTINHCYNEGEEKNKLSFWYWIWGIS